MWWITGIVVVVILIATIIIVGIVAKRDNGDYGDGGGTHIGSAQTTSFFAPANDRAGVYGESFANSNLRIILREMNTYYKSTITIKKWWIRGNRYSVVGQTRLFSFA